MTAGCSYWVVKQHKMQFQKNMVKQLHHYTCVKTGKHQESTNL